LDLTVGGGLSRIPSGGGSPTPVTELNKGKGEVMHSYPQVLPGSQAVLFTSGTSGHSLEDADIDVLLFKTGERKTLHQKGFHGRYVAISHGAGYLVYRSQNTLFAAPFDLGRLAMTGTPQPVLEGVSASFDFSQTGTFAYIAEEQQLRSIFWLDTAGNIQPLHSTPGFYVSPRFSPDGKRLAFAIAGLRRVGQLWVKDLERGTTSRLTSLPGRNEHAVWTPDGKSIVFRSFRGVAQSNMYWIRADGGGEAQQLTEGMVQQMPRSFSPDGKWLAYDQISAGGRFEIWTAPVQLDRDRGTLGVRLGKAEQLLPTPFDEHNPAFSPDGRWLAYSSDETGIYEVYVSTFQGPGGKALISTGGGTRPIWSRDGRELFYLGPDQRIMVAEYTAKGDSFTARKPRVWSEKRLLVAPFSVYDLAPDGKRFAVFLYPNGTAEPEQKATDSVTVLLNFVDELRRRAAAGGN
jgi:serine/threonine-protein kinase